MNKFKPGDTVRLVTDDSFHGLLGKVISRKEFEEFYGPLFTKPAENLVFLKIGEIGNGYMTEYAEYLELVKEK